LKLFQEGEWGRRENNAGNQPNLGKIYVYMEMKPPV
jgi:hypothetical protein